MNEPLCRSESPSAYKIVLGIHTERATEASKQDRDVSKIIKGPAGTDIALLKLDRLASCCIAIANQITHCESSEGCNILEDSPVLTFETVV